MATNETKEGIVYETEKEMEQAIEVLVNFDDTKARTVANHLKNSADPIYILGMGSSLLFPAKNAKKRAFKFLPERRVEIGYPNNFEDLDFPENAHVFLSSNSGGTLEILEIADRLKKRNINIFAVTTGKKSDLLSICNDAYILQGGAEKFEKGVAATKSIIDQALFYDAVIHAIVSREFPLGKNGKLTEKVAEQMKRNFKGNSPDREKTSDCILYPALSAETFYWIDHDTGVGEELALKSCEIAGKRGIYESGTQILHGRGEVIEPSDLVFIINPNSYTDKDKSDFREKLVGARVISLENNNDFENLQAETTENYESYSQLPAAWNFLRNVGRALGSNIDKPRVAQKYRAK